MTRAIESVQGIRRVTVLFEEARAIVESDDCSQPVLEQISKELDSMGYGGTVIAIDEL